MTNEQILEFATSLAVMARKLEDVLEPLEQKLEELQEIEETSDDQDNQASILTGVVDYLSYIIGSLDELLDVPQDADVLNYHKSALGQALLIAHRS